jgi:hypothetical protein
MERSTGKKQWQKREKCREQGGEVKQSFLGRTFRAIENLFSME